ncbi:MAG: DNRLRE domain-containing protein, partial [Planctomycetia bacterium]|nr:DNRLRE domain-containing protein [Planctomycetia bacterium]
MSAKRRHARLSRRSKTANRTITSLQGTRWTGTLQALEPRELLSATDDTETLNIVAAPSAFRAGDISVKSVGWSGQEVGRTLQHSSAGLGANGDGVAATFGPGEYWAFQGERDGVLMGIQFDSFSKVDGDAALLTVGERETFKITADSLIDGFWRAPKSIPFRAFETMRLDALTPSANEDNAVGDATAVDAPQARWRVAGLELLGADEATVGGFADLAPAIVVTPTQRDEYGRETPQRPGFVVTGGDTETFLVDTEYDPAGRPKAVIGVAEGARIQSAVEHRLELQYFDGAQWLYPLIATVRAIDSSALPQLQGPGIQEAAASTSDWGTTWMQLLAPGRRDLGDSTAWDLPRSAFVSVTGLRDISLLKDPVLGGVAIDTTGDKPEADGAQGSGVVFQTLSIDDETPEDPLVISADTRVYSAAGSTGTNFSGQDYLASSNWTTLVQQQSYLQFTLPDFGGTVDTAELVLYRNGGAGTTTQRVEIVSTTPVNIGALTWNNSTGFAFGANSKTFTFSTSETAFTIDVSDFVRAASIRIGDMNGDGVRDIWDQGPYTLARTNLPLFSSTYPLVNAARIGDVNQDGSFNVSDDAPMQAMANGAQAWPSTTNPPLTLRVSTPTAYATNTSAVYHSKESTTPEFRPRLNVTTSTPELAATLFDVQGNNLRLRYDVANSFVDPFTVGIYASPDGVAQGKLLQTVQVTEVNRRGIGVNQDLVVPAAFTDLPEDYYLLAVIDPYRALEDVNRTNNRIAFAGGVFSVGDVVHVQAGTATANDSISIGVSGANVSVTWGAANWSFTSASVAEVHVRPHLGNDTV